VSFSRKILRSTLGGVEWTDIKRDSDKKIGTRNEERLK
jgi:hypothetical protein